MGIIIDYFSDENVKNKNKTEETFKKPKFYGNLDGPSFIELDYNRLYGTRHYNKALLVSSIVTGDFDSGWKTGLQTLLKYFRGANQKKWYLPKTCPVLIKKQYHVDKKQLASLMSALTEYQKVTVSMFIPTYFNDDPPGPTNSDVFIEEDCKRIIYTGYYEKNLITSNIESEKNELSNTLRSKEAEFDDASVYLALYNLNKRLLNTHNYYELWYKGEILNDDYTCVKTYLEEEHEGDDEQN